MKTYLNYQAFTLVELLVAIALTSVIGLSYVLLNKAEFEAQTTNDRLNSATLLTREFFDYRAKVFQAATDGGLYIYDYTDNTTSDLTAEGVYSADQIQPPTPAQSLPGYDGTSATAVKTYRTIRIPTQGCFGTFFETLTTECVVPGPSIPSLDWSTLSTADFSDLRACYPPCSTDKIPRIKIVRSGTAFSNASYFPLGDGSGTDGNPVGAALCISINGTTVTDYRDVNLKVLTLIRTGSNKIKLIRHEANYPRPKQVRANSILPKPVGCDRCVSGRAKCP